ATISSALVIRDSCRDSSSSLSSSPERGGISTDCSLGSVFLGPRATRSLPECAHPRACRTIFLRAGATDCADSGGTDRDSGGPHHLLGRRQGCREPPAQGLVRLRMEPRRQPEPLGLGQPPVR